MTSRDYLIIAGVPKSGTTSIAEFLGQLPDVAVARTKETGYFTDFDTRSWVGPGIGFAQSLIHDDAAFEQEFSDKPDARLRVEASTDNLWCPGTAERIRAFSKREHVGAVRIAMIFRDPIKRIVSEYEHTLRLGWQTGSLLSSLQAEAKRLEQGWHPLFLHVTRSRYASQLKAYRSAFLAEQLLILDYHLLGTEKDWTNDLLDFIKIERPSEMPEVGRENQRYVSTKPLITKGLKSDLVHELGRTLVPQKYRSAIRAAITPKSQPRYQPSEEELAFIRDALADEIAACRADPSIPTDHWD